MPRRSNTRAPHAPAAAAAAAAAGDAAMAAPAVPRAKPKYAVIGSKLPMHLVMQLCKKTTNRITGQFGATTEEIYVKFGDVHHVRGTGYPNGTPPKGFPKPPHVNDAGFAITRNIPYDFAVEWFAQNGDTDMVKNGILTMEADLDSLDDLSMDFAKVDSGLGPMNPDGDPRAPKPISNDISEISTAERSA